MGDAGFNRARRRLASWQPKPLIALPDPPAGIGHNGGPPLDQVPEWGPGGIGNYFEWRAASEAAFRVPAEVAMRRARRAEALGLTYAEYQLKILERGRHLQAADTVRIAEIIAHRQRP